MQVSVVSKRLAWVRAKVLREVAAVSDSAQALQAVRR